MKNEIIETYLKAAGIGKQKAAKVREIACKVGEFYRANDIGEKPGIDTRTAKLALIDLNLPDDTRRELARRLDKYAAMVSGAKYAGSTADMITVEFSEYVGKCCQFAAEMLGVSIPLP